MEFQGRGEHPTVATRPPLCQAPCELAPRQRVPPKQIDSNSSEFVDIKSGCLAGEVPRLRAAVEHRLDRGSQPDDIAACHQMLRAPQSGAANHLPGRQQPHQVIDVKIGCSRPEPDVWPVGLLGLQSDEALDDPESGTRFAAQ